MHLILIRHPESAYNAAGNRYCGRTDALLSDKGLQQVERLEACGGGGMKHIPSAALPGESAQLTSTPEWCVG